MSMSNALACHCHVWSLCHLLWSRVKMSCRLVSQKAASRHISLQSASSADARSVGLASRRRLRRRSALLLAACMYTLA